MKVASRLIAPLIIACAAAPGAQAAADRLVLALAQAPDAGAAPSVPAPEQTDEKPQEVLIRADKMSYDANTDIVSAEGNVEITYGARTLLAEKLSYNQKTRIVVAEGNATLREANGTVLSGNRIEVTDDMRDGIIDSLSVVIAERGRLAAAKATRQSGNVMTLEKAVYTTCKPCQTNPQKDPTWQIKAFRIVYNQEKARVEYEDAFFEVFGVPVVYLPYFSHSDPEAPRESGFLVPNVGHSSDLGYFLEVPYYFALDPSYDLVLAPLFTENDGPLLKSEWRQRTESGVYNLQFSARYGRPRDDAGVEFGDDTLQGHIFGEGNFTIDDV